MEMERPDWDSYFLILTAAARARATCDRGRCGSVIARDNQTLATGYVGAPPGFPRCDTVGHLLHRNETTQTVHCVRTIHAEQNAIIQAAKHGVSINGGTLYSTMTPCYACAKMILSAGIVRVVAQNGYRAQDDALATLTEGGVETLILGAILVY